MKSRTDARAMSLFSQSTSAPARLWRRAGRPAAQAMMETLEDRRLMAIVVNNGQALADLNIDLNSGVMVFDLTGRYNDDGITGTLVRFNTTSGTIDVELFDQAGAARNRTTPITVTNFLNYIANGRYINNVFHRSVPGFVVQGGGFSLPSQNNTAPPAIASDPAIQNEPGNNNIRGTIAMAKLGGDPNSATNQWFFNLADNRGNLDNQNGGFTAFGRIINGLSVPDAISNLRRRNFGSPFDELPVRDSYDDQTIRPADFVTTSSIAVNGDRASVVNQSLTYTVTSSNPTLVSAYLYNGRLVVAPGQNLSGSADITVTITGVDGSTTTDVFSVNVGAGQAAAQLQVAPLPIGGVGAAFTATAGGATFADVDVNTVSFYLDSNRNGAFDIETDMLLGQDGPDGGFVFSGNANGFSAGVNLIFARGALTSGGNTAVASAVAFVNASPTINSVSATPNPILTQGASITITANTVVDADGSIARVRFYLDSNGDGMLQTDTDTLLGEDTSAVGGYSISNISTTGFTLGTSLNRIFAQATDNEGAVSVAVSTTVRVNTAPVITVFNNVTALRPNVAVLSATATDDGNNITRVQFFRDSNGNGTFDPDTDTLIGEDTTATNGVYSINLATATLSLGNLAVFARALDADNTTGAIATAIVAISSAPPTVASVTRTPDPLPMVGSMLRLTATNVRDLDSTIARVEFYRGPVGLTTFDPMMVTLIGMDTSSIGGYTLEVAATDALGFAPGMYRIFAVAVDTDGVSTLAANVPSVTGRINAVPTIGSVVPTNATVARLTSATFTANNVADDAGVTRVEFYRDLNGNGTLDIGIDRLLGSDASATGGYTLTTSTAGFATGENTIFARVVDNNGGVSAAASTILMVVNANPTITSVAGTPRPVISLGSPMTLTATGQRDTDGTIAQVQFYLDTNGIAGLQTDTDTLLGADTLAAGGYKLITTALASAGWVEGANTVFAVVVDSDGATAVTPGATVTVNPRPTIDMLTTSVAGLTRLDTVLLTATSVADNGTIRRVEFYRDVNGNGTIEVGTDRLLGSDSSASLGYTFLASSAGFATGPNTILARAIDNNNAASEAEAAVLIVNNRAPTITSATVRLSPLPFLGQAITITANAVRDADGSVTGVRFFRESNGIAGLQTTSDGMTPGDTLLLEDELAAGGYTASIATTELRGFQVGMNTLYALALDNESAGTAVTVIFTINADNELPVIGSLGAPEGVVPRLTRITLSATGITDADVSDTIRAVEFYRDVNGNAQVDVGIDQLLGRATRATAGVFSITNVATTLFRTGDNVILARAQDSKNALGEIFTGTVNISNVAPTVAAITASPATVAMLGGTLRLTATNPRDTDGTIASVQFWRDDDGNGLLDTMIDTLLGTDTSATGGYTVTVTASEANGFSEGTRAYFARVLDNDGQVATTIPTVNVRINAAPVFADFTATPDPLTRTGTFTLTAFDVLDPDNGATNAIRSVQFFFDTNNNGILDAGDRSIATATRVTSTNNWTATRNGSTLPTGDSVRIFARATDTNGAIGVTSQVFTII